MFVLVKDRTEPERQAVISSVEAKTRAFSTPAILDGDRFTFQQQAYVAVAQKSL